MNQKHLHLLPQPRYIETTGFRFPLRDRRLRVPAKWRKPARNALGERLKIVSTGGELALSVHCGNDEREEAYRLEIGRGPESGVEIQIESNGPRGVEWALRTLAQNITACGDTLLGVTIEDRPAFPVRGVMLDISRDRVPRQDELLRIVDQLASFKFNHLQIYTEHTFAYKGHEEVWREASPLTSEEVRELDAYCLARGVTLAANQNCFGHLNRWLKHPRYAPLAETQDFWEWGGRKIPGPFSLCPGDPGSIALVEDLLRQLLPNFSSRLVNIGCDEALDVGQGRSREDVAKRGSAEVYFDFVKQVTAIAKRLRFKPMFWADIALSHPESLNLIPEDMIALAWGYEPDAPFEDWVKRLREIGREVWVCPGTSSWRSITGRTTERRGNLEAAAKALRSGASGYLVTDWGDAGHRQQWPVSLIGLAEAAEFAWNGPEAKLNSDVISLHAFGDSSGKAALWLAELGDVDYFLRKIGGKPNIDGSPTPLTNSSALFRELDLPLSEPVGAGGEADWKKVLERVIGLSEHIPKVGSAQITDELKHTVAVARWAAEKALLRRQEIGIPDKDFFRLKSEMVDLIAEHKRLWLLRSREGGLVDSCRYYEKALC